MDVHTDPTARAAALLRDHRASIDRLDAIIDLMGSGAVRAVDCFKVLFRRPIGLDVIGMATGESLAHLRRLEVEGRAVREESGGTWWYSRR